MLSVAALVEYCVCVCETPDACHSYCLLVSSSGFCRLIPHARSPGTWTIYFEGADYESHLSREHTDLASIVRLVEEKKCASWDLEVRCIFIPLLTVNIIVIRKFKNHL